MTRAMYRQAQIEQFNTNGDILSQSSDLNKQNNKFCTRTCTPVIPLRAIWWPNMNAGHVCPLVGFVSWLLWVQISVMLKKAIWLLPASRGFESYVCKYMYKASQKSLVYQLLPWKNLFMIYHCIGYMDMIEQSPHWPVSTPLGTTRKM